MGWGGERVGGIGDSGGCGGRGGPVFVEVDGTRRCPPFSPSPAGPALAATPRPRPILKAAAFWSLLFVWVIKFMPVEFTGTVIGRSL